MTESNTPSGPRINNVPRQQQAEHNPGVEFQDCTPCRVIGAGAFIGLGTYTYISGHSQLRQQEATILKSGSIFGIRSRRMGISGLAASLVGLGLYRFFA